MTSLMLPQCYLCKHRIKEKGAPRCAAFPDGIPQVIIGGDHDHTEEYPGDKGIRFEPETTDE